MNDTPLRATIPDTVRVAGADIAIKKVSFKDNAREVIELNDGSIVYLADLDGFWLFDSLEIWINTDNAQGVQERVFLHELQHVFDSFLTEGGELKRNEQETSRAAQIFQAFIADNLLNMYPCKCKRRPK